MVFLRGTLQGKLQAWVCGRSNQYYLNYSTHSNKIHRTLFAPAFLIKIPQTIMGKSSSVLFLLYQCGGVAFRESKMPE